METYAFGICSLGGRVDLERFFERMRSFYPELKKEIIRGEQFLIFNIAAGELEQKEERISFALSIYQNGDGNGIILLKIESKDKLESLFRSPSDFMFGKGEIGGHLLGFLKQSYGLENIQNIQTVVRRKGGIEDLKSRTGIEISLIGEEEFQSGFSTSESLLWTKEKFDPSILYNARNISKGGDGIYGLSKREFFAKSIHKEIVLDFAFLQLRENAVIRHKSASLLWLSVLRRKLIKLMESTDIGKDEWERLSMKFRLFSSYTKEFMTRAEMPSLYVVDRDAFEFFSNFQRQKRLVEELLIEEEKILKAGSEHFAVMESEKLSKKIEKVGMKLWFILFAIVAVAIIDILFRWKTGWIRALAILLLLFLVATPFLSRWLLYKKEEK